MAELAGRADENAAARADEREALSAIFDGVSLNDESVEAPLDLDAGDDDATLFEPGDKAMLRFTLSPAYPLDAPATAAVAWATAYRVPTSIKDHVDAAVVAALAHTQGDAAIYSAVAAANDALNEEAERHAAAYASWRSAAPPVTSREEVVWQGTEGLTRRLIYSHHIIAPSKRAGLRECAQILGVTTLVKIGWPGAICLEGPKDRVDAFVNHITRWRWKQLAVRGEQDTETRALPRIFLETSDMSTFAGHLRNAGLEELFLRLFK